MSDMQIDQLLAQMRTVASSSGIETPGIAGGDGGNTGTDFAEMLKASMDKVNETQKAAGEMAERFEVGDPQVQLSEVMVALQKADISFKAMTEVRNRLVDAYQEIMNMPV